MMRAALLAAARSEHVEALVTKAPVSRGVVRRFVAGTEPADGVDAVRRLHAVGLLASLDCLGEDTRDAATARALTASYLELLRRLDEAGLATDMEASVKLTALGLDVDPALGLEQAARVVAAAEAVGARVTVDMEDHTRTDATLAAVTELRRDHPDVGVVLQARLRRTEADAAALAGPASRVRLCKGAYAEPASVAFQNKGEVDAAYLRSLRLLMAGAGTPLVATHDPALIAAAGDLAVESGRGAGDFEYQLLYGVRPDEQRRLAAAGARVRVYIPYGQRWYGYLMRRLAERPANLVFFLRALAGRS